MTGVRTILSDKPGRLGMGIDPAVSRGVLRPVFDRRIARTDA
jgi:hypothetical protein